MWKKIGNIYSATHAQVPVVFSKEQSWQIFYSDRIDSKSIPNYVEISKESLDIIDRSKFPLIDLGRRGTFDWAGIMPTSVVTVGQELFLYYIGWSVRKDVPYHNSLGLMVSKDAGKTFYKFSDGPIFSTSRKEPGYIGTMYVLQDEGLFKGWYLSCRNWIETPDGKFEPVYDIKYAISSNGIDWEPTGQTCIELQDEEGGISQASVVKNEQGYHMWFSVRGKFDFRRMNSNSYRIKYASSFDGINWNRNNIGTVELNLDISKDGWDSEMVEYPCVISENNNFFMFYNGNGFGKTGIGLARWNSNKSFKSTRRMDL